VRQPLIIALLAVPIVIQVYLNAGIAYGLNRALGVPHNVACLSALIGASNFFELAVAAAIALFDFHSGAALATVVGVLVEVPVMLSVVRIVLRTRGWYEHRDGAVTHDLPGISEPRAALTFALAAAEMPKQDSARSAPDTR
jgi:ACR3 family arsenite transporter